MGTVFPQLTILFLLLFFHFCRAFRLRREKSNAYCHPQPQNRSKDIQAPNSYSQ